MEILTESTFTRDEMERRRLLAAQDLLNGISQSHVARKFSVSRTTASRWRRALDANGVEALKKRRATGRPSRLTRDQLAQIREIYFQGPAAWGFPTGRWTTARMAEAIFARFAVRYDPDHVGRLLHRLNLVPVRPARQRHTFYAASRYSPNTSLSLPEISPTVA
jgi:transposase